MRNALAGDLSPSLTACNTRPRWPCSRWLISALLLLAFCLQAFIWELVCWWPLGYWPPITVLGDLSPDLSVTWSTCHPASGPCGSLLLTSSTTDDRSDQDPCNSSSMSFSLGIGCLYLMVMLLMALQSQHILHLPSFLGTNKTGTTQGLRLFWTQPLSNKSCTCDSISLVSSRLVL